MFLKMSCYTKMSEAIDIACNQLSSKQAESLKRIVKTYDESFLEYLDDEFEEVVIDPEELYDYFTSNEIDKTYEVWKSEQEEADRIDYYEQMGRDNF